MELEPDRTEAPAGVVVHTDGPRWQVINDGPEPVRVRAARRVFRVRHRGPLRMFCHGYQSWSWSGLSVLGEDLDPSHTEGALTLLRGMHHADEAVAAEGELRSELLTLLADDDGVAVLGADGGDRHDTTFRLRATGDGRAELAVEAFLGGAELAPGEGLALHDLLTDDTDDPVAGLSWWAASVGRRHRARVAAPYQLGWCSWYQYFHAVTEADVRANLSRVADWPFEVFQVDDGFQRTVGDWLETNGDFPSSLPTLASDIAAAGATPGIWLAPFLASPDSAVASGHPGWVAERAPGRPLIGMLNEGWGGVVHTLDTTHPGVLEHLEATARQLVEWGYRYLKLDFTYAPSLDGRFHDPSRTPAQRVRDGLDAVRRGAGEDTFLLGCGAPLGACVGVVDGMRIGADVAPRWRARQADPGAQGGYERTQPAVANALQDTLSRAFLHRRLWLNDPDCLMLRTTDTELSEEAAETWALAVAVSGGMALVSDDLAILDRGARKRLGEVVALGRAVDEAARAGDVPAAPDVLEHHRARELAGGGRVLHVDPDAATATLQG